MTKHFLSGLVIAILLAAPAGAADLPVKALPLPAPVATWTGFYLGANIGGGWQKADTSLSPTNDPRSGLVATSFDLAFANGVIPGASSQNSSGVLGGITLGYNLQRGAFVFGLEGDFMGTHLNATSTTTNTNAVIQLITTSTTTNTDWLATVRGRIGGVLIADTLLYATGGLAVGQVNGSTSITPSDAILGTSTCAIAAFCSAGSASNTQVGWTAGIGAERKFTRGLSAKIEYLHYDLGTVSYTVNEVSPGFSTLAGVPNVNISTRITGDIVRAGLNWRL